MQKLEIKGGRKISGTIVISGSKNATLPILASTILTNKKIKITQVKSRIGYSQKAKATLDALGLRKINQSVILNSMLVGMQPEK